MPCDDEWLDSCMTYDLVRWATNENGIMLSRTGFADRECRDTVTLLGRLFSLQTCERGVIIEKLLDRRFHNMTYGATACCGSATGCKHGDRHRG